MTLEQSFNMLNMCLKKMHFLDYSVTPQQNNPTHVVMP